MSVKIRGAVHLARRTVPVERERQRHPAGLRAQLLLADIVRPAAAGLPDAAAEHQHIDQATVVHIHVIPVVETGADDNHRASARFVGSLGELARDSLQMLTRHAADLLRPGGRIGFYVVIALRAVGVVQSAIQPVVGQQQIVDRHHAARRAVRQGDMFHRQLMQQDRVLFHMAEVRAFIAAVIGKRHRRHVVAVVNQAETQRYLLARRQRFQVPFALFAPAETGGAVRRHQVAGFAEGDGFPFRVVGFAQPVGEIGGAQQAAGSVVARLVLLQQHQHRHIGIASRVAEEVVAGIGKMKLFQNNVAHRHRQRAVGALLRRQPLVAQLGHFRIVGADGDGFGAFIAHLGKEMGVGGARLRHVGAPGDDIAGVVPVGGLRYVGLFAPGHRRRGRQIAVPVVKTQAGGADQRQIARAGSVRDHRHRRDRRKARHAIRPARFNCPDVGGRDQGV